VASIYSIIVGFGGVVMEVEVFVAVEQPARAQLKIRRMVIEVTQ